MRRQAYPVVNKNPPTTLYATMMKIPDADGVDQPPTGDPLVHESIELPQGQGQLALPGCFAHNLKRRASWVNRGDQLWERIVIVANCVRFLEQEAGSRQLLPYTGEAVTRRGAYMFREPVGHS
jgi:hypothetical protein